MPLSENQPESRSPDAIREHSQELGKRVKELSCLHEFSLLVEKNHSSLDDLFNALVFLLPPAWQFPEIAGAKLIFDKKVFATANFKGSPWRLTCDIMVHGEKCGVLTVGYIEKRPDADEGPFLKEERQLLTIIGERLGRIVERKRTETALRESEERYRRLLENGNDAIYIHPVNDDGLPGDFSEVNEVACRRLGYTREEMLRMSPAKIDAPEMLERLRETMRMLQIEGQAIFEMVHMAKDGRRIPVEINAHLFTLGEKRMVMSIARDITDRRLAEEKLRESEQKFSKTFSCAPLIFTLTDYTTGVFLDVNDEFCRVSGWRPEEVLGKSSKDIAWIRAEDRARIIEALDANGRAIDLDIDVKTKNGVAVTCLYNGEIIHVQGKKRIVSVAQDISERKITEESLRSSESQLSRLFNDSPVAIAFSCQGKYVKVNEKYFDMFGYTQADLLGKPISTVIHPESRAQLKAFIAQREKGERGILRFEIKAQRKNGEAFDLEVVSSVCTIDGKDYSIAHHYDITTRKKAEAALREGRERLQAVLDATPFPVAVVDPQDNVIQYWSKSAHELFGHTAPSAPEWYQLAYPDPDYRQEVIDRWKPFLETAQKTGKTVNTGEYQIACRDGSVRTCELYATFIKDNLIVTFNDITERKKTETILQNTQKLESLGMLAGGIAHDFNNLLGGIYGYIDLAGELANELGRETKLHLYLSKAMETIDRSRDLTRQLITFSKGGEPVLAKARLFPFVKDTAQFALSGSNVSLAVDVEEDLWASKFDRNQIGQVVDNIVINAKQAMPEGGTIEIVARNLALSENEHPNLKAGRYVKLSIRDHGIGMPKEILPRIFDPFYTTKATGHGLGLATSYSIVKRHDGAIEVESEPGKGSSFHIFLPAEAGPVASSRAKVSRPFKGSGTFLIMDDQEVMRDISRDMLESLGYTVVYAESGQIAIDLITKEIKSGGTIAGAIFDLTVPGGMGGREAVDKLRDLGITLPIFAASGHADDPVLARPVDFGFTGSITKPFRKADLAELLGKHLKQRGGDR
jgi:PAS domain S-box-containing protein